MNPGSTSSGPRRRRWPLFTGVGAAVIALFAVVYTAFSPASGPAPAAASTQGQAADSGSGPAGVAFAAATLSGQPIAVPGDKPSVVFFFSATCGTCGPGAQALARAQQGSPEANYVAVDIDPSETPTDVQKFLTANGATGLAYALDTGGRLTKAYQLTRLSTAVVLNPRGDIVYRGIDPTPEQLRAALATAGGR